MTAPQDTSSPSDLPLRAQLLMWWVIWFGILSSLLGFHFVMPPIDTGLAPTVAFVGLVPLTVSAVIRWVVLPKVTDLRVGLVLFLVGLGSAEACGLLGKFTGGENAESLLLLGLLGVVQFMPTFAARQFGPKGELRG
jgi:FtsH-binding integral membrane protein